MGNLSEIIDRCLSIIASLLVIGGVIAGYAGIVYGLWENLIFKVVIVIIIIVAIIFLIFYLHRKKSKKTGDEQPPKQPPPPIVTESPPVPPLYQSTKITRIEEKIGERRISPSGETTEIGIERTIVYTNGKASAAAKLPPPQPPSDAANFNKSITHLKSGDAKFHENDFTGAEEEYRNAYSYALKTNIKELIAITLYELGASVGMQGKNEDALKCFNEAITVNPNFAEAWYNKGVALGNLEKYEEALKCFEKAIAINPNYAGAWHNKGVELGNLEKYEEALKCFEKAIEINPNFANAWSNKGMALKFSGKVAEAEKCFAEAKKLGLKV
jgi:TolA-binding protein